LPIEKTFAISATPSKIYEAIERDLAGAAEHEGSTFEVTERDPPEAMALRVTIGGMPCKLRYRIEEVEGGSFVTASLEPYGFKYAAFQVMTFGMHNHGFEAALVESLANLKAGVEGR
jgi:hypothetical protein